MKIIKLRPLWYVISGSLMVASILSLAIFGLKFGIDFTGGTLISVRFQDRPTSVEIERSLEANNLGSIVIQPVGEKDVNLRTKTLTNDESTAVVENLGKAFSGVEQLRIDSIGPSVGAELRAKSIKALIISLFAILAYIAYAFRKVSAPIKNWKYGVVTIFAAVHDVLLPLGVMSVLGVALGWEVDVTFVVAILTVLGYSINDTIVVLDRVRENLHKVSGSFVEILEVSVHQTLLRSLNTSVTTLFALVAIFFFGGASLRPFALTLIIGVISGTYSSIFVTAPLLYTWEKFARKK